MTAPTPDVPAEIVGFLDESPHVRSSSRLLALLCYVSSALLGLALIAYVFVCLLVTHTEVSVSVMGGFTACITAFGTWGLIHEIKRTQ